MDVSCLSEGIGVYPSQRQEHRGRALAVLPSLVHFQIRQPASQESHKMTDNLFPSQSERRRQAFAYVEQAQLSHDEQAITANNFVDYTCFYTGAMRAAETLREDAIVKDPFAQALAGQVGQQLVVASPSTQLDTMIDFMAIRTRYIDQALTQRDPSIQQVVILAAGLDARAYRLDSLANARVFEVDRCKGLMQHKLQVLTHQLQAKPLAEQVVIVEADVILDPLAEVLEKAGFDAGKPTFWILEGLVYYLTKDAIATLLKRMDALSAPKSEFWLDLCGKAVLEDCAWDFTSLVTFGEDDALGGVVTAIGDWELKEQASLSQESMHFGRAWKPFQVELKNQQKQTLPWALVTGTKRAHKCCAAVESLE